MLLLALGFAGIWILALGITLWGTWSVHRGFSDKSQGSSELPPVSILKPLKGFDPGLTSNLESFFQLKYPRYELLFCLETEKDAALSVVNSLREKYPKVSSRIFFSGAAVVRNPKVHNLRDAYEHSKFEHILISDSNVRVPGDYLSYLVAELTPKVGIVTAVVAGTKSQGWGGALESIYLNTFYARWMFLSGKLGFPTVVGKSMLFRRSTMERLGGISTLGCYIAEDYMAGRAMLNLGLSVALARVPVSQYIGNYTFHEFWSRHLRWGRIRKSHAPLAFLFEPLFLFLPSTILGAFAFHYFFQVDYSAFVLFNFIIWYGADLTLMTRLSGVNLRMLCTWFLREFLAVPQWIHMALGSTVQWRGRTLTLESGGFLN